MLEINSTDLSLTVEEHEHSLNVTLCKTTWNWNIKTKKHHFCTTMLTVLPFLAWADPHPVEAAILIQIHHLLTIPLLAMVAEPKNCKYKMSMKRVDGCSIVIKYMIHAKFQFHMNYALWHSLCGTPMILMWGRWHLTTRVSTCFWLWKTLRTLQILL